VNDAAEASERNSLSAEIEASRERVWAALSSDLRASGPHVEVMVREPPRRLQLQLRRAGGEVQLLDYRLEALGEEHTLVVASVHSRGPLYLLKRMLTFGRLDDSYLDAVAVGLENLRRHLEGE